MVKRCFELGFFEVEEYVEASTQSEDTAWLQVES